MKIYFSHLTWGANEPLVWEYDDKTNRAECLFITTRHTEELNHEEVIKKFTEKKYPEISVVDGSIIIKDFSAFSRKYPASKCRLSDASRLVKLKGEDEIVERANPVYGRRTSKITRDKSLKGDTPSTSGEPAAVTLRKSTKSSSSSHFFKSKASKSSYDSIILKKLIVKEDNPGLWSDTLGCIEYFTRKTNSDRATRLEIYLKNETSFHKECQYARNDAIYPLKKDIILLMGDLFEKELNPAYQEWKAKNDAKLSAEILKEIFKYLRLAVWRVMLNEPFNSKPTKYEQLSDEEKRLKFSNQEQYEFANAQERKSNIQLMKVDWLALLDKSCSLKLGHVESLSEKAFSKLESFRTHLLSDPERLARINEYFEELDKLLIDSGKVECKNAQLAEDLKRSLSDHTKSIDDCSSLLGVIEGILIAAHQSLKKKHSGGEHQCTICAEQIVIHVVNKIYLDNEFNDTPNIAKLQSIDKNIYLHKDWMKAVQKCLGTFGWKKIVGNLADKKRNAEDIEKIADEIYNVLRAEANELKSIHSSPLVPGATSSTDDNEEGRSIIGHGM